ncbi:TetR/AcrR family transcriptional regulator [Streptomyces uncialis]|uniref:TetR/AcrR family transcriptional regulator n=1 Tax=Streptomyces uncialis TaxID=1048205 RepID=UPI00386ACE4B|nr:TetR/AcrR family transcriptional regulator [Streptomyces uncialis]
MTPAGRRVLAAAERLFYDRGIHAVGVDLIAAEAGVTKKTLYDRFGSKDQLVVEYLADRDERWRAYLLDRLGAAAPADRLRTVFDASAAWMTEHSPRGCGMVNARAEISDPGHPALTVISGQKRWMLDLFTRLVHEGGGAGTGRRADAVARSVMLLHEGALVAHGLGLFPDPVGHAGARAVELAGPPGRGR